MSSLSPHLRAATTAASSRRVVREPRPHGSRGLEAEMTRGDDEFERFAAEVRPRLIRAFVPIRGIEGAADAASEALAHGFEHWDEVRTMTNPSGWLYRVGQSRTRPRKVA